jgi:hypothetical protein
MAELHIKSLTCLNRQDTTTRDDAVLQINGSTISGPHDMSGNETVNLNVRRAFTGSVSVTLVELDNATADDILGTVNISDALVGQGDQTGRFHDAPNADYHMNFDVHA